MAKNTEDWKHPEQKKGEVFVGYMDRTAFICLEYTGKRLGENVYDSSHRLVENNYKLHPVFVSMEEYIKQAEQSTIQTALK